MQKCEFKGQEGKAYSEGRQINTFVKSGRLLFSFLTTIDN